MNKERNVHVIARIHTDFPTKFGIPRQSGLIEELKAEIIFEPEYRNPDALRGIEEFSHLWLCDRLVSEEISAWVFLPPDLRFVRIRSGFPVFVWILWNIIRNMGRCFMYPELI